MSNNDAPDESKASLSTNFNVQVRGFDEVVANRVGQQVYAVARGLSVSLPLENLEGITIGADYNEALQSIDRGYPKGTASLQPTEDREFGTGIAMAVPVNRKGDLKTHIVFDGCIADLIESDDEKDALRAAELVVHEVGHAVDHELKFRQFGNIYAMEVPDLVPDTVDQYLWDLSHFVWDEYFANRISAPFGDGERESQLFLEVVPRFESQIFDARCEYRDTHISLDKFLGIVKHNLRLAFLATAYLLGFNDGNENSGALTMHATERLHSPENEKLLLFHDVLRTIWERRGNWASYEEFLALNQPTLNLLHSIELYPSTTEEGGLYMDVPIRF